MLLPRALVFQVQQRHHIRTRTHNITINFNRNLSRPCNFRRALCFSPCRVCWPMRGQYIPILSIWAGSNLYHRLFFVFLFIYYQLPPIFYLTSIRMALSISIQVLDYQFDHIMWSLRYFIFACFTRVFIWLFVHYFSIESSCIYIITLINSTDRSDVRITAPSQSFPTRTRFCCRPHWQQILSRAASLGRYRWTRWTRWTH